MDYYLSYGRGFTDAKLGEACDEMDFLIVFAEHDRSMGFCENFQIYDETGNVVFESLRRSVARSKESPSHIVD